MVGGSGNGNGNDGRSRRAYAGPWIAAVALVAAWTVAGCAQDPAPAGAPGSAAPTPPSAAPGLSIPPTPTGDDHRPGPKEVLVEVNVSGGLAGVANQLIVRYDGSYTTRSGTGPPRTGRMTPAEVAELRTALEAPAYAAVPARPTGEPVADGFQYVVSYRHRVIVAGDGGRPAALERVFAALPDGGPPTNP
ncbi:hypothetical protein [Streptomyces sp. NPDC006551]|uniref:hypothetical protein n=1 Tax=Streptomyces sp. NPDC006551 TaxID=3157178 RepID=UPI0033A1378F